MRQDFSPEKYLTNINLLELTLRQLEKDFNEIGEQLTFSYEKISFENLVASLKNQLIAIENKRPGILNQLFYRIDLPEKKIKAVRDGNADFYFSAAELILKRELQKVVIREYYKKI